MTQFCSEKNHIENSVFENGGNYCSFSNIVHFRGLLSFAKTETSHNGVLRIVLIRLNEILNASPVPKQFLCRGSVSKET